MTARYTKFDPWQVTDGAGAPKDFSNFSNFSSPDTATTDIQGPAPDGCVIPGCKGEAWAFSPNGQGLCEQHYSVVQDSKLAMFALERGATIVDLRAYAASKGKNPLALATATTTKTCSECSNPRVDTSTYCVRHLRGHLVYVLDQSHWPRLRLTDGRIVDTGIDCWRQALAEMGGHELSELARLIERQVPLEELGANA